jgi:hypothetical protein
MRDQLEHSFRRQVDTSSANSAGHVMCYRLQYAPCFGEPHGDT